MIKPDFFLVGAAKCGTSSMYEYLSAHPEIYMSPLKEPNYFCTDLPMDAPATLEEYLALFEGAREEKRVGEASAWYLYSKRAPVGIKELSPSARILIMLRNPVDMLYSLHSQLYFVGIESIEIFEDALDAEKDRREGRRLPGNVRSAEVLFYRDICRFWEQVARYFEVFGKDRVRVIIFDDFKEDTVRVYRETCAFLGVDESFQPDFTIHNPNKGRHSRGLAGIMFRPPALLRSLYRLLIPHGRLRRRVSAAVHTWNMKYEPRSAMNPETRRKLQSELAPDVDRLSELLGRDLSCWYRNQARAE